MMRTYAAISGAETGQAKREGRDYDFPSALKKLLRTMYPDRPDEELSQRVDGAFDQVRMYSDMPGIMQHVAKKNPKLSGQDIEEAVIKSKAIIDESNKFIVVCTVVAGVIEDKYGHEDRAEYLFEVLAGNAK